MLTEAGQPRQRAPSLGVDHAAVDRAEHGLDHRARHACPTAPSCSSAAPPRTATNSCTTSDHLSLRHHPHRRPRLLRRGLHHLPRARAHPRHHRRRALHHPDRRHARPRARAAHRGRDQRTRHPLQPHAGAQRCAHQRHARLARQRRPRPAHARSPACRPAPSSPCSRKNPTRSREALADAVEEAERLNAMLAHHHGHLRGAGRRAQARPRDPSRSSPSSPGSSSSTTTSRRTRTSRSDRPSTPPARLPPTATGSSFSSATCSTMRSSTPPTAAASISAPTSHPRRFPSPYADTGIGIDAADLPRIWDRLYRADKSRSQRGLGLGLSLVKAFVEAHGGTATVESEPGRGSKFTLTIPQPPVPPDTRQL